MEGKRTFYAKGERMSSKLIFITVLFFTTNIFAGNWFVGINGGGNVTRKTPVGDLPMAREEFGVNNIGRDDLSESSRIIVDVINQGKTFKEALEAISHLNKVQLNYKNGFNLSLSAGYHLSNLDFGLLWKYTSIRYKSIHAVADGEDEPIFYWVNGLGSGKTILNSFMGFVEYNIHRIKFYGAVPVVGAGVGFSMAEDKLTINSETAKRNQAVFAYQIKAGVNYNFNDNWQASVETVFFGTSKVDATNNYIKSWQFINLGVRYLIN
jgi:opacity protein-like surface antigen